MLAIQYDLFEDNSDLNLLKQEIQQVKKCSDNVRRGLFARHNALANLIVKQQDEIDQLKRMLLEIRK